VDESLAILRGALSEFAAEALARDAALERQNAELAEQAGGRFPRQGTVVESPGSARLQCGIPY